jgi:hypothetical protein
MVPLQLHTRPLRAPQVEGAIAGVMSALMIGIQGADSEYNEKVQGARQVRKTPSWPSNWASSSPLSLHSHRNAWAHLHLLGQPNTLLAVHCQWLKEQRMPKERSPGYVSHSDITLYIPVVILYTHYTGRRQNDFTVCA